MFKHGFLSSISYRVAQRGWVAVCCSLLVACASTPPTQNGKLLPPAGQGYVILATTYQKTGGSVSGVAGVEISDGVKEFSVQSGARIVAPEGGRDAEGGLHAIALAPGKYRIISVFGSYQASRMSFGFGLSAFTGHTGLGLGLETPGTSRENFAVPVQYEFDVAAGEVVYIGSTMITLDRIARAELRDESTRDFFYMKTQWKISDFSNIQKRIARQN